MDYISLGVKLFILVTRNLLIISDCQKR
ncbi:unnamed protein product [Larinioides sclopetarius]|uniref:Uncharacterized protein n=1 Tax=Larinioides sclopetarius TaxID=280406 RepID=A0AAV2BCL2_9ARAC